MKKSIVEEINQEIKKYFVAVFFVNVKHINIMDLISMLCF